MTEIVPEYQPIGAGVKDDFPYRGICPSERHRADGFRPSDALFPFRRLSALA
jgi:hypothetical protein